MTELDLRKAAWNDGLGVPFEAIATDLYHLACIFHASGSFSCEYSETLALRKNLQEAEIGRLLISVAATIRNAMDQNPSRADHWLQDADDEVGTLWNTASRDPSSKALGFREACNKIIHCWAINFDYASENPRRGDALLPHVHLYGDHRGQDWKCTIHIAKFIEIGQLLNV